MKKTCLLLILIIFVSSCVPSKDLVYLQGEPVAKTEIDRINNIPYKLQVDDIINIEIHSLATDKTLIEPYLKNDSEYNIDNHGNIRFPNIGNINVLGYTTVEVRKKIETELKKLFKNNEDVFVSVKIPGIKYTIIGEIASQGPKVLEQNRVSIIDAIANSGGITTVGNRKKVEIIRKSIDGIEKFTIDLTKISAYNSNVFYIKPNDVINVIPLKQKAWGTGTTGLQTLSTIVSVFTLITSTFILARNL